jgi:hypothetical protein
VPFQRMREARPREAHEVTMMLPHAQKVCSCRLRSKRNTPSSAVSFFYDRPRRTIPSPRIRARSFSATGNSSSGLLGPDMPVLRGTRTRTMRFLPHRGWMDVRRNSRMRSRG